MVAMIVGMIFIAFTVFAALPAGLAWGDEILAFLKGCLPVACGLIGIVSIMVGVADIKDRNEAKKEEELSNQN